MDIPLNIDWQQILLHLLNFSILTLGLYWLLYNPVKNFMAERTAYYDSLDIDAKEKLQQAEALETSYRQRLADMDATIEKRRADAARQTQKAVDKLLEDAKEQAAKLISDAQTTARREREKILEDAQQEIVSLAMAATEKLLAQSASGALDRFLAAAKKE